MEINNLTPKDYVKFNNEKQEELQKELQVELDKNVQKKLIKASF